MNEISIRKRTWMRGDVQVMNYQLDYKDHNGKRRREQIDAQPVRVDDREALLQLRAEAMRQAQIIAQALEISQRTGDSSQFKACNMSMQQLLQEYLHPEMERERNRNIARQMQTRLERFRMSSKPIANWTKQDSKDFMRFMAAGDSIAQNTLKLYWQVFTRCIHYALDSKYIQEDPIRGLKCQGGYRSQSRTDTLKEHELRQLLNTEFREDIRGIAMWSLTVGLYYADYRKLYRSDMTPREDGTYALSWKRKKTSGASLAIVTQEMLQHTTGDGEQLFPVMKFGRNWINRQLAAWALKAGLYRDGEPLQLNMQYLRRTFGNMSRLHGSSDPQVLQVMLGHNSTAMQKHYTNPEQQEVIAASQGLHNFYKSL